ncbi:MAG: electron transporter SenC [Rhodocyclales bacterium RIFCSPLOWO2_02_FULL_63_24]|nr:MAG: electron transporter SenC [Rhodocyclales bacterium GWA2_65_19]OHC68982.1 MAG: electron transporter SenC [Rhodocyclales bacterium RIFCSPLOWO2_02_FULL_63_24]
MFRALLHAALAAAVLAAAPGVGASDTVPAPKLVERPQGARSGLTLTTLDEQAALQRSQGVLGKPVGDHVLLDRQERPTPLAKYRGKPLLVNFVYTACFQVCPTTTKNLQKAVENTVGMLGADRFNIVSIGFNQPFDSPQAMKAFAYQYGIHLPNWEFLSPAAAIVDELTQNFGFSYVATSAGFDHMNQVTLVDAEGRIVRQIYGETFTAADLAEPLKAMITGAPIPPQTSTLAEIADRIRILCSVYDPISGKYRTNYALYFEIAGFISFMMFMAWLAWSFMRSRGGDKIQSG